MISVPENIGPVIEAAMSTLRGKEHPSVLDVGVGFGKYGLLLREAVMAERAEAGELEPRDSLILDGVESACYFARHRWLNHLYRVIEWRSVDDYLDWTDRANTEQRFDLVLLVDVVEHWPIPEGLDRVRRLLELGPVLISTPKHVVMYEPHYYGQGCPRHESQWDEATFRLLGGTQTLHASPHSWIMLVS